MSSPNAGQWLTHLSHLPTASMSDHWHSTACKSLPCSPAHLSETNTAFRKASLFCASSRLCQLCKTRCSLLRMASLPPNSSSCMQKRAGINIWESHAWMCARKTSVCHMWYVNFFPKPESCNLDQRNATLWHLPCSIRMTLVQSSQTPAAGPSWSRWSCPWRPWCQIL